MSVHIQTKAVVTVAEMARMVGLSRARFYQLQRAGVFPLPVYSVSTRRPVYVEEMQQDCLEVRRRNCGINGQPVLFYARRNGSVPAASKNRKSHGSPRQDGPHAEVLAGVRSLGLTRATVDEVEAAVKELFPQGTPAVDPGEVIRVVFVHLKRRHSGDNLRR
jgi:hypothetical protein